MRLKMIFEFNGFALQLSLTAARHGQWIDLPLNKSDDGHSFDHRGIVGKLVLKELAEQVDYTLQFISPFRTRLRLWIELSGQTNPFHLIPGNIHGDNNAAHVRSGEFP